MRSVNATLVSVSESAAEDREGGRLSPRSVGEGGFQLIGSDLIIRAQGNSKHADRAESAVTGKLPQRVRHLPGAPVMEMTAPNSFGLH